MWTRALEHADTSCGGKAFGLARLIAAGLRVPEGFVIDGRAFRVATGDRVQSSDSDATLEPDPGISLRLRPDGPEGLGHTLGELALQVMTTELPEELITEVEDRARALGGPFAVRSSATIEDGEAGAAAGVFSSRTAVQIDELWVAIRSVWVSALTPLAATYARRRGGEIAISVIVQRYVTGELMTVYTRPPGAPEANELWQQHRGTLSQMTREPGSRYLQVERVLDTPRGVDIELIVPVYEVERERHPADPSVDDRETIGFDHAWFVQARPIIHPVFAPRSAPPPTVLAVLDDGRRWKLDLAHNPDPLSTAQADLVERVERAGAAPWSARVCAGYLYSTPNRDVVVPPAANLDDLRAQVEAIEGRLARALDVQAPPMGHGLAAVIERYLAFYRIWAYELGPLIAANRGATPAQRGERADATEAWLLAAAHGVLTDESVVDLLAVLSPAWDVATLTFGERPVLVRDAISRARAGIAAGSVARRDELLTPPDPTIATVEYFAFRRALAGVRNHEVTTSAALAADLAERDDFYFAVAQWTMRRAILQRADELGIAREDAFWIPIDDLITGDLDPIDVRRRASGAQAAAMRASTWNMPIVVGDPSATAGSPVEDSLRGIGSGHRITGRVRRFESLAAAIVVGHGDIVVTRAVTPALAVIVIGCAAIISETGGLLDHGAAMARELGIPCVVGCRDAWSRLADGMIVSIDNDHVTITR